MFVGTPKSYDTYRQQLKRNGDTASVGYTTETATMDLNSGAFISPSQVVLQLLHLLLPTVATACIMAYGVGELLGGFSNGHDA